MRNELGKFSNIILMALFLTLIYFSSLSFSLPSDTVCIFKHSNSDSLYAIKDYLSANFTTTFVTGYNFHNCSLLIVDQEEKNSYNPAFDVQAMVNGIKASHVPTILIYNSVMLVNPLFNISDVKVGYWNPASNDRLYIRVIDNSSFLNYPNGTDIPVWTQVPGIDYSWYFYKHDNNSGKVLSEIKICYYGQCSIATIPSIVYYPEKILALRLFRFSSCFHPTPQAFSILEKAADFLLYGRAGQANVNVEDASWKASLIVEFNSSGQADRDCQAPEIESVMVNGKEANFTENYFHVLKNCSGSCSEGGNDYARYRFSVSVNSTRLGNVSVSFSDSCGHIGRFRVIRTNQRRSGIFLISGPSWMSVIRSSIYGYPVMVDDGTEMKQKWIRRFIRKWKPRTVMCVDDENPVCDFSIDSASLHYQFKRNQSVWIDHNRTMQLYAASYAAITGRYLSFDGGECWKSDCSWIRLDRLGRMQDLVSRFNYTGKYAVAGLASCRPDSWLPALLPVLASHGYAPVVMEYNCSGNAGTGNGIILGDHDEILNMTSEISMYETLHEQAARPGPYEAAMAKRNRMLLLINMPSERVVSPVPEWAGKQNITSDYAYRESLFEHRMSRLTSDIQLMPLFVKPDTNPILIAASYRQPRYLDAQWTGMDSGFLMDLFLRIKGFNVTRRVEHRITLSGLMMDNFNFMSEDAFIEAMIQEVLENLGVSKAFNDYLDTKYTLLETDWDKTFALQPSLLEQLNNSKLLRELNRTDVFFYFGAGNSTSLILPPDISPTERDLITNPYPPGNEIHADEIPSMINVLDSDYSADMNNSQFLDLPFVLGWSGDGHDPFATMELIALIGAIRSNDSFSSVPWRMHDQVEMFSDGSLMSKLFSLPVSFMSHQYLVENAIGLPDIGLDPDPSPEEQNISYQNNTWFISKSMDLPFTISNGTITYSNVSFYLMDADRPVIPVYLFEFPVNGNVTNVSFSADFGYAELKPEFVRIGNETRNLSWDLPWHIERMDDGLKVYVIPVRYNLSGPDIYMKSFSIRIAYSPELEIGWNCTNGTVMAWATSPANLSVPLLNLTNSSFLRFRLDGTADIYAYDGRNVVSRTVRCQPLKSSFRPPTFSIIKTTRSPEGMLKLMQNFWMKLVYNVSDRTSITYVAPSVYLFSEQRPGSRIQTFVTPEYRLEMFSNATTRRTSLFSPSGMMVRSLDSGAMNEYASGSVSKLDDIMNEAINSFRSNMSYVENIVEAYK